MTPKSVVLVQKQSKDLGLFQFLLCGHSQQINIGAVKAGRYRCQSCKAAEIEAALKKRGLTLVSKHNNAGLFEVTVDACGHRHFLQPTAAKDGRFKCAECFTLRLKAEAKERGLEFLRKSAPKTGSYRFECCGAERELLFSHVRKGKFACAACGKSWLTKPAYLYLVFIADAGEQLLKIGVSVNPARRYTEYGVPASASVEEVAAKAMPSAAEALKAEARIKKKLKRFQVKETRHILQVSGHTECFTTECLKTLKSFML